MHVVDVQGLGCWETFGPTTKEGGWEGQCTLSGAPQVLNEDSVTLFITIAKGSQGCQRTTCAVVHNMTCCKRSRQTVKDNLHAKRIKISTNAGKARTYSSREHHNPLHFAAGDAQPLSHNTAVVGPQCGLPLPLFKAKVCVCATRGAPKLPPSAHSMKANADTAWCDTHCATLSAVPCVLVHTRWSSHSHTLLKLIVEPPCLLAATATLGQAAQTF